MRRRLLRHPLGGRIDPEAAFRALAAAHDDVFWLDSGKHGVHALGSGARILPERGAVLDTLRAELERAPDEPYRPYPGFDGFRSGVPGCVGSEYGEETTGGPEPRPAQH